MLIDRCESVGKDDSRGLLLRMVWDGSRQWTAEIKSRQRQRESATEPSYMTHRAEMSGQRNAGIRIRKEWR
jgi:hypothetical protein